MRMLRAPFASLCLAAACSSLPPGGDPTLVVDGGATPDAVAVDRSAPNDVVAAPDAPAPDRVTPIDAAAVDDRPAGPDVAVPTDVPAADVQVSGPVAAALPVIDAATRARVLELRALGQSRGVRANVFAKIGDSITESASFLFDIGEGWYDLGAYAAVEPTITFFRAQVIADERNSFNRASLCATAGWTAARALEGDPSSALRAELAASRPAYAVVMYGTNEVDMSTPEAAATTLNRVLDIIEQNGTVPVLSTIPDRTDGARAGGQSLLINQGIRAIATARHLPLMDYWAALQALPAKGLDADGIHPNVYRVGADPQAGDFTTAGLRFGYNMRNLVAVLSLDRVRGVR